jgi:hypothetical protein
MTGWLANAGATNLTPVSASAGASREFGAALKSILAADGLHSGGFA